MHVFKGCSQGQGAQINKTRGYNRDIVNNMTKVKADGILQGEYKQAYRYNKLNRLGISVEWWKRVKGFKKTENRQKPRDRARNTVTRHELGNYENS